VEQIADHFIHLEITFQDRDSFKGLLIALGIITTWAISLMSLLLLNLSKVHFLGAVLAILIQTFLYTGLFITAHDAMHRSLFPRNHKINDFLGTLCVRLYAFFSYRQLLKNHWLHHRYPASDRDPDFHNGQFCHSIPWFFNFIKHYYGWSQFITAATTYTLANQLFQISQANLLLFWVLPALLSSVQLFYFGTFLPHREPQEGYTNVHRARSNSFSTFWSFLSCYHFGYHEEHHAYPSIPWWQLPIIRKQRIEAVPVE
jgi:beta-carotene ketolase (CrtW type)